MDNLTHTLVGIHLARLPAFRPIPVRLAFWTGLVAANLPDVDGILRLVSQEAYVFEHRGITHSFVGVAVMAPLLALAATGIGRRVRQRGFLPLLGLCTLVLCSHLLLDYLTSWGTMLLLPFSHERLALPWLFVLDPVVWALLGIPLLLSAWKVRRGGMPDRVWRRSSVAALVVFALYVGLGGIARERARGAALAQLAEDAGRPKEVLAFPVPPGPLLWNVVVRTDDQRWHHGFASTLTGGVTWLGELPTGLHDPRVQVALETGPGSTYRWFAAALYRVSASDLRSDGSWEVVLGDLRFAGPWTDQVPFQMRLEIGPDFQVRTWSFETGRLSPDPPPEGEERS